MSVKKSAGISERKALIPAFFYDMACAMYYPPLRQTRAGWGGRGRRGRHCPVNMESAMCCPVLRRIQTDGAGSYNEEL